MYLYKHCSIQNDKFSYIIIPASEVVSVTVVLLIVILVTVAIAATVVLVLTIEDTVATN